MGHSRKRPAQGRRICRKRASCRGLPVLCRTAGRSCRRSTCSLWVAPWRLATFRSCQRHCRGEWISRITLTGPVARSGRAAGWRRSWRCRSFSPRRMSSPWLSLRATTRSRSYGSGLTVGLYRLIGRGGIRGRRRVVAGGCGGWCGQTDAALETQRGAVP